MISMQGNKKITVYHVKHSKPQYDLGNLSNTQINLAKNQNLVSYIFILMPCANRHNDDITLKETRI